MGVVVPHKAIDIVANAKDPKKAILEALGDLSGLRLQANQVCVATYFRPAKTAGGIIRPDINLEEDMWQGKVGLIVKLGPEAFKDSEDYKFAEASRRKVGDWAVYHVNEARNVGVKGYPCRFMADSAIKAEVDDPNMIF
jgi:hypothetical protein